MNNDDATSASILSLTLFALWVYGLLFWFCLALVPWFMGFNALGVLFILLFWFGCLMLGRQRPARRWLIVGGVAVFLACVAQPLYGDWRAGMGCPHCLEAEWGFMALANSGTGPWVLWGLEVGSLALALLLPHPRWEWCGKGVPSLWPHLVACFIVIWPLLFSAFTLWALLSPTPDYGG